jgi:lysophospholipase L1-like esterase
MARERAKRGLYPGVNPGVILALAGVFFSVVLSELVLRLSGIPAQPFLEEVQFGWPDPQTLRDEYVRDPDLFWVPKTYKASLADAQRVPPEIVFLGDSCTQFGTYPARVVEKIRSQTGNGALQGLSVGVGGWSSAQGLRQLERDIAPLHPNVVTVFFGWNDHWRHFGASDQDIAWVSAPLPFLPFHLKIVELFKRAYVIFRSDPKGLRVPASNFEAILRDIVTTSRHKGIIPVLITAPSSLVMGREPERLAQRWVRDLRDVVPLHQHYVSIVREVAAATGSPLCDLAARFDELPAPQRETEYMLSDGIHFTPAGDEVLANLIVQCLRQNSLVGLSPSTP